MEKETKIIDLSIDMFAPEFIQNNSQQRPFFIQYLKIYYLWV
jgi:hypothetical protein